MKKALAILLLLSLAMFACRDEKESRNEAGLNPNPDTNKSAKIADLLSKYEENLGFSGSILVAENGKIIYQKGIGHANKELEVPNKPDTKHRIGSLTKQFTAVLILQLAEKEQLDLNATVDTYFPDYPRAGGDKITIHHLLTHSSGIPRFRLENYRDPYTPEELIDLWNASGLDYEPGSQFTYSNPGYFLLGVIIEKVTNKPYEQVLKEEILMPLGMENSGYDRHHKLLKERSSGYVKKGLQYENAGYADMTVPYAAGAMYSTVEDMYLWDQALYSNAILSKEFSDLMFKSHISGLGRYYGYGWFNSKYPIGSTKDSVDVIEHSGGIQGYSARITRIPEDKHLIVILSNVQGTSTRPLTFAINGILYDKPYEFPKRPFADHLSNEMDTNGLKAGLLFFEKYKDTGIYSINEGKLNRLGYDYLRSNKKDIALEIFKINAQLFPESFNVFDSLGEIYLLMENKNLAMENYKKSLSLNPENTNAAKMLNELQKNTN